MRHDFKELNDLLVGVTMTTARYTAILKCVQDMCNKAFDAGCNAGAGCPTVNEWPNGSERAP